MCVFLGSGNFSGAYFIESKGLTSSVPFGTGYMLKGNDTLERYFLRGSFTADNASILLMISRILYMLTCRDVSHNRLIGGHRQHCEIWPVVCF